MDDDFGPIRQEEDGGTVGEVDDGGFMASSRAISVLVRSIVDPQYYASNMTNPTKDRDLYNILIESENASTFAIAEHIFKAVQESRLMLTRKALASLSELTHELLQIYIFKKSPMTRQLIYQFMRATLTVWIDDSESVTGAAEEIFPLWQWCSDNLIAGRLTDWKDRHAILTLLEEYLGRDAEERRWRSDAVMETSDGLPSAQMLKLLDDTDIRVRLRVATSLAKPLQSDTMAIKAKTPGRYYLEIAEHFRTGGSSKEVLMTRILVMANVVICSSAARRAPFFHLYDTVTGHPVMQDHVNAAFNAVTCSLRIQTLAKLYLGYAARLLAAQGREGQDPFALAVELYGFQQRTVWAKATLEVTGPFLLMDQECYGFWESLVQAAKLDAREIVKQHLPPAIALAAATWAMMDERGDKFKENINGLRQRVASHLGKSWKGWNFDEGQLAILYTSLFRLIDERFPPETILEMLMSGGSKTSSTREQAETYKALLVPDGRPAPRPLEEALTPKCSAQEVLHAHCLLSVDFKANPSQVIVHALTQTLCWIGESCLINERRRLAYGLTLLLAMYSSHLTEEACFDSIFAFAAIIFQQEDLCEIGMTYLLWVLDTLGTERATCRATAAHLSGIAVVASEMAFRAGTMGLVGRDALLAMEAFMTSILQQNKSESSSWKALREDVMTLIAVWPRTLPATLSEQAPTRYSGLSRSAVFGDSVMGKFSICKPLSKAVSVRTLPAEDYRRNLFWHLRAALSAGNPILHDDIQAFLHLFYEADGVIEIPSHSTIGVLPGSSGVPPSSIPLSGPVNRPPSVAVSQRRILMLVYAQLRSVRLQDVQTAFRALAGIASIARDLIDDAGLLPVVKSTLLLLARPIPTPGGANEAPGELVDLASENTADSHWAIRFARRLVVDLGSTSNIGYLYLLDLFDGADSAVTERYIPALMHLVLHYAQQGGDRKVPTIRAVYSTYLNGILQNAETSVAQVRIIVQAALYLRFFAAPSTSPDHGDNRWLEMNNKELARGALRCHLPETALLFWEIYRGAELEERPQAELTESDLQVGFRRREWVKIAYSPSNSCFQRYTTG